MINATTDQFAGHGPGYQWPIACQNPERIPLSIAERMAEWRSRFQNTRVMDGTVALENGQIVLTHGCKGTLRTVLQTL